jgi:hypothetical protein
MNLKFIEVKFQNLKAEVNEFIKKTYNKSDILLSAADPYGHILGAIEMIFHSSLLYLKNVTAQFDINNPQNNNGTMIKALARVGGYNPSRAISATGTLALQLKPGIDILEEIAGGEITIMNGTKLTNKSNNLDYYIDLSIDKASYMLSHNTKYYLPIVQGTPQTYPFTGTGSKLQSFSVNLPNGQSPEQFRVTVKVNGQVWAKKDSIYDMLPDEEACIIRTGITGGLDIYFGTGFFGKIPSISDQIEVRYIVSDGALGNIPHKIPNDWTFSDEVFDKFGTPVDMDKNFNVFIHNEISMGGDSEDPKFTKAILPYVSRNFVLARPEQYIFHLKRLNMFSQIDAYTTEKGTDNDDGNDKDDSVVYLFLIPDVSLFLQGGSSYFDLDLNAFILEQFEKDKVERYLRTQGIIGLGNAVKIIDPIIRKYIINIHLRIFEDANEDNIRSEINSRLSTYFGSLQRRGIIPKSDIIKIIEEIDGVDSIDCSFISEANETYHLAFEKYKTSIMRSNPKINPSAIKMTGYSPNRVIGLDPKLGDILYNKNELPIIRGGFRTRNDVYYNETPNGKGLSSINIEILSVSKRRIF